MYLDGKEPLLPMANACLTLIEGSGKILGGKGGRRAASLLYNIHELVLSNLGRIVSTCGDEKEARKLGSSATRKPLRGNEKQWVEDVIKALIRRKAEYDADPMSPLAQITMAHFVTL
jgi:hypothetical protein